MCSETFLRLPEEKRKRVLDAAWGEFTRVSYAEVSINQIIQRAGISRGSFYQYFKDKEALMRYLMQEGWAYLMRGYHANLKAVGGDLFALQLLCFDQFLDQWEHTDPVLERFLLHAAEADFSVKGLTFSPIRGPEGNIEYLLHLRNCTDGTTFTNDTIGAKEIVESAHSTLDK